MRSVYNFVVKPKGERYNNTTKVGGSELILNTGIFNHQYVNREAIVISTPIAGHTDIKPGDTVIVHHNVFRRWNDMRGVEKNSRSYFNESTYFINHDQIFLYKRDKEWIAPKGYCFVKPLKELNDQFNIKLDKTRYSLSPSTINSYSLLGLKPIKSPIFTVPSEYLTIP